jgi:hypothetical protein
MIRFLLTAAAALAAAALLIGQGPPPGFGKGKAKGPGPCDRACLEGFVNDYLDGLVAHSAFSLPFAKKVQFTENNQELDLGDGLWNVTSGLGKYKLYVADTQSQQVGFLGTVLENERPVILALRLKIDERKISEMESLVYRGNGAASLQTPDALFTSEVAEPQRVPRAQIVAATEAWFDAIERSDASLAPLDPACERTENAAKISEPCAQQINSKHLSHYPVIYPRRTPIVDEERQLVFGFFLLQQPGDVTSVLTPTGTHKFSAAESQPAFVELGQVFKLTAGKIRKMEGVSITLPYGTPDPYSNDDWRRGER